MRILLIILLFLNFAFATESKTNDEIEYKFRPDYWSKGFHLNIGGGLNFTEFNADKHYSGVGYGLNFKTDLGYFFTNRFALEWSSNVKFDRIHEYLVWDTLFTFGVRYRIKEYYVRAFYGKAPTVLFFNHKQPPEYKNTKASRLQFDGPVFGVALGKTFQHKEKGIIWFIEGSGTLQKLLRRDAIHMDGQVPDVISRENDNSTVVSFYLMIGMMVF